MYQANVSLTERTKQDQYLKQKIQEAFYLFERDKDRKSEERKGLLERPKIPHLMRYLGIFPTEEKLKDVILPELEGDDASEFIKLSNFETVMLRLMKEREYEYEDRETLMAAFRLLDPENKGYIPFDQMKTMAKGFGFEFRESNWDSLKKFVFGEDKDNNAHGDHGEGHQHQNLQFNYELYVSKLYNFYDKHFDSMRADYEKFILKQEEQI